MKTPHDEAQLGLDQIKRAVRRTLATSSSGMTNAEIADALGLRTSFQGKHKNYLTYSVLQLLSDAGELTSRTDGRSRYYALSKN